MWRRITKAVDGDKGSAGVVPRDVPSEISEEYARCLERAELWRLGRVVGDMTSRVAILRCRCESSPRRSERRPGPAGMPHLRPGAQAGAAARHAGDALLRYWQHTRGRSSSITRPSADGASWRPNSMDYVFISCSFCSSCDNSKFCDFTPGNLTKRCLLGQPGSRTPEE